MMSLSTTISDSSPQPRVGGPTPVLEKARAEAAPERGHWRNVFELRSENGRSTCNMDKVQPGGGWLGEKEWIPPARFSSEAEAVAEGHRVDGMCRLSTNFTNWYYLRSEFFPEYA